MSPAPVDSSQADEPGSWKARYASLLAEHERRKTEWQEGEKLLSRVITRLAAVAGGLDGAIEPYLKQIRDLLRQGEQTEALRSELDGISAALFRAALNRSTVDHNDRPGSLFRFFNAFATSEQERDALEALRERAERSEFDGEPALFSALERQLEQMAGALPETREEGSDKPGFFTRLFGRSSAGQGGGKIDLAPVHRNLLALLEAVEPPLALQQRANQLRERLHGHLDGTTLLALFDDAVDYLVKVKSSAENEHKMLETFLGDLTDKLLELERRALGFHALTKASEQGSSDLRATVADHMANLKSSASSATDIEQLKAIISHRLEIVANYLDKEREVELQRIQETQQQVEQLTQRLQGLETEAADLRTKLRVERSMAMRDGLTGLPNRKAYDERIAQEVARWRRFGTPFCLLVWDVDHFKGINDRFGHKAGDKALAVIAQELAASIRATDFVGRYGGEEFAMILCGTDKAAAWKVAEGIRGKVEQCGFNSRGKPVKITASCGISQYDEGETPEHVFERADRGLYQAKRDGRNRCIAV